MRLHERVRPATLDDIAGQDKAVSLVRRIIDAGAGGTAVWISGPSGMGKTTLARIIAGSVADDWFIRELDSGAELTADMRRSMRSEMGLYAGGKGGRAWIINEAHQMRSDAVTDMLGIIERLPDHCCLVFTTTSEGAALFADANIDAGPFASRCDCVQLTNQGVAQAFADRLCMVADMIGVTLTPGDALKLVRKHKSNLRAALCELERMG